MFLGVKIGQHKVYAFSSDSGACFFLTAEKGKKETYIHLFIVFEVEDKPSVIIIHNTP